MWGQPPPAVFRAEGPNAAGCRLLKSVELSPPDGRRRLSPHGLCSSLIMLAITFCPALASEVNPGSYQQQSPASPDNLQQR